MRLAYRRNRRGFTLVELMIVVAIIGVLAALAIYGVNKYMAASKVAEAKNALGIMAKGNIAAYNNEGMTGQVLPDTAAAGLSNKICESASAMVPATANLIQGRKYQSAPADWNPAADQTSGSAAHGRGFVCLKFSMDQAQYYMYGYTAANVTSSSASFSAIAHGDLTGDGVLSTFILNGATGGGRVKLAPAITETNPEE